MGREIVRMLNVDSAFRARPLETAAADADARREISYKNQTMADSLAEQCRCPKCRAEHRRSSLQEMMNLSGGASGSLLEKIQASLV